MPTIATLTAEALKTLNGPPQLPQESYHFVPWDTLATHAQGQDPTPLSSPPGVKSLDTLHASFDRIMDLGWAPFAPGYISTGRGTNPNAQEGPDMQALADYLLPAYSEQGPPPPSSMPHIRASAGTSLTERLPRVPPPALPRDEPSKHLAHRLPEKQSRLKHKLALLSAIGLTMLGAAYATVGSYMQMRGR